MISGSLVLHNTGDRTAHFRIMRAFRRAYGLAAYAAESSAAGRRDSALHAFDLAGRQYRTSLETLLLSDDLTESQREDFQVKLKTLADLLKTLGDLIDEMGVAAMMADRGGITSGNGECRVGDNRNVPDTLWRAMMTAGRHMVNVLTLEEKLSRVELNNGEGGLSKLRAAQKLAELSQKTYDHAVRRYREAIALSPARILSQETLFVLGDERLVACLLKSVREHRRSRASFASWKGESVS